MYIGEEHCDRRKSAVIGRGRSEEMMLDGKRLRLHGGISSIESIRTLGTRSVETHGSISCLTRHNDNDEPCWKAWD